MNVSCDRESLSLYVDYFCKAYILYAVPFHTDSLAQSRVNPPKIYPVDVGIVRAMNTKQSLDNGHLLETLVFLHLRRNGYQVEYLVTKNGFEVDFIAGRKFEHEYTVIQVCHTLSDVKTLERETRALVDVMDSLAAKECLIVTWNEEKELDHGIRVVPVWKFLLGK